MDFEGLGHCFGSEFWIRVAFKIFDRVDGRAGEEQNVFDHATFLRVGEVGPDVALIEASGAHNHDRFYSRKRPAEGRFRRLPFLTVRFQERQAWLDRGSLAKIDSIEAGEKIDDFAPDGSSFHADPRIVPINRGRRGELSGRLPNHADRAAGKGFTEHDPRGPLLHGGKESAEDFVGRARDVRSEDQTQSSALILVPFDGLNGQPDSLRDGGIIKIREEVLILLYKHYYRAR